MLEFELELPEEIEFDLGQFSLGGTMDHSELTNRNIANQHPISAITNLQETLDTKGTYTKPNTGIPLTDLTSTIQASLSKADSAIQTETDPTVPAWAKNPNKPTYTATEIGADTSQQVNQKISTAVSGLASKSYVDSEIQSVEEEIPTKVSQLDNDSGYLTTHQSLSAYRTAAAQDLVDNAQNSAISTIEGKIPTSATTENQLADKGFVNSSINSAAAFFRGSFATKAALLAVPWQTTNPSGANYVSNNDYAYIEADESHSNEGWRYIYVLQTGGTDNGWHSQFKVNDTPFTQAQINAINSGATTTNIAQITTNQNSITTHTANTNNPHNVSKSQVGLENVDNTADINKPISTATQTALNQKQDTLVSGTSIKTINSQSLLGSGNIEIGGTIQDVQVNGTSVVNSGIANIPTASTSGPGVIKYTQGQGLSMAADKSLYVVYAVPAEIEAKTNKRNCITPGYLDKAVMEGLGNNSLTWSDAYKSSARATIGAISASEVPVELPVVSSEDNGKFLRVVNGVWASATIENASGGSY